MLFGLSTQQIIFFIILISSFTLLITEKLRSDLVAVLIIIALAVTGILLPEEALSGFGSEPAIIVVSIFVISGAFLKTGLADIIGAWVSKLAGNSLTRALIVIMVSVAILSAFTHHVTTTAVMLPVVLSLCRERGFAPSKLLIPLSLAASLGTTITIIGAPAFLIASDVLIRAGRPGLGMFDITPIGIALSAAGTIFILLIGRHMLPNRKNNDDITNFFRLDTYYTEIKIMPDSIFVGKTIKQLKDEDHFQFTVAGWKRNGKRLRGFIRSKLKQDDVLLIHTTPEDIVAFRKAKGIELHPVEKFGVEDLQNEHLDENEEFIQAVIDPFSDLIGRTLKDIDFKRMFNAVVVGLWRKESIIKQDLSLVKLRGGDVLVLHGTKETFSNLMNNPAFLMLVPFHSELRLKKKAKLTAFIMLLTIIAAGFGIMDLHIIMLSGAAAMVLSGCISPRQAYSSIDSRVFVFIAGAIPLGAAIQKTGTDNLIAVWLNNAVAGMSPFMILMIIFIIVAVITQFLSDAGTTAFFAPVAIALAGLLNLPPEPFVVTVAMSAVSAFLTPIGHHGNLLIYGPGGYRFKDFMIIGIPVTLIIGVIVVVISQMLWQA